MPRISTRRTTARPAPGARAAQSGRAAPVAAPASSVTVHGACDCGRVEGREARPHKLNCALVRALTGTLHRNVRGLGQKRKDKDLYETPVDCATAICGRLKRILVLGIAADRDNCVACDEEREISGEWCERHRVDRPLRIIEPSAGTGNFVRGMRAAWPNAIILANDLFPANAQKLHAAGATSYTTGKWEEQRNIMDADLHAGNPPFSLAEKHIEHSLSLLREGAYLAQLLPVSFHGSQGRCKRLWTPHGPDDVFGCGQLRYYFTIAERPSYGYGGKTDMVEYGVFVFQKGFVGTAGLLTPLFWRPEETA
jgi:hypothetical protein